jgi:hypothetical protein
MTDYEVAILTPPEPRVTECVDAPGSTPTTWGCRGCDYRRICDIYAEDARCNAADAAYDAKREDAL